MCKTADPLLLMGRILVEEGLISEEKLEAVLLHQVGHRALRWPGKKLGEHLVAENLISRDDLEAFLHGRDSASVSREEAILGEIAIRNGLLTRQELFACLREQATGRTTGDARRRIGRLILSKGLLTEQELQALLDRQKTLLDAAEKPRPREDALEEREIRV